MSPRRLVASAALVLIAAAAAVAADGPCRLVFVEQTDAAINRQLAHIEFRLDYPRDKLAFGSPIACAAHALQTGASATFTDDPFAGILEATLSRANGLFPYPLVVCTPTGTEDAQTATLELSVIEARDTGGAALDPPAVVGVETFECTTTTTTEVTTTTTDHPTTTTIEETTTTTLEPPDDLCGDADDNGSIAASDALLALRAAVGGAQCPLSRCDTDASGTLTTSDALRILRKAIGIAESLDCQA